jgi:hypothetical protein
VLEIWHRKDSVGDALFYQKMTVFWSFSTASTPAATDGLKLIERSESGFKPFRLTAIVKTRPTCKLKK